MRTQSNITLLLGDCLVKLRELENNSVDAIVTDPPYGLSFMGKKWDYDVPSVEIWKECLRVLKPGGYLLAFAGTRTQHRMAVRIEDAGFEIRDMIAWVYGSGFPKSLNIGKAVDKIQGNEREVIGTRKVPDQRGGGINSQRTAEVGVPTRLTQDTKGTSQWEGWGTALKPALEPITVARKPLENGLNVAQNCLKWGTGGINIDACRVDTPDTYKAKGMKSLGVMHDDNWKPKEVAQEMHMSGRFPANLIHDGSQQVMELFPMTKSGNIKPYMNKNSGYRVGQYDGTDRFNNANFTGDSGSAARFFYCAKASAKERNIGLDDLEPVRHSDRIKEDGTGGNNPRNRTNNKKKNFHPTVKPIALMEYLVKLVSREGAVVLDPFMGSGTTGIACKKLKREFIGIELSEEYLEIAKARINCY